MTFADSVLHLVRVGARIDPWEAPGDAAPPEGAAFSAPNIAAGQADVLMESSARSPIESAAPELLERLDAEMAAGAAPDLNVVEPGLPDLEAAVALVSTGLASRVVLSGFTSWPGLLWRAYQLADSAGVQIIPTVVRPGGKVDIVITRDTASNG